MQPCRATDIGIVNMPASYRFLLKARYTLEHVDFNSTKTE